MGTSNWGGKELEPPHGEVCPLCCGLGGEGGVVRIRVTYDNYLCNS